MIPLKLISNVLVQTLKRSQVKPWFLLCPSTLSVVNNHVNCNGAASSLNGYMLAFDTWASPLWPLQVPLWSRLWDPTSRGSSAPCSVTILCQSTSTTWTCKPPGLSFSLSLSLFSCWASLLLLILITEMKAIYSLPLLQSFESFTA